MTKHGQMNDSTTDRPIEIEITPEMLEAGMIELGCYDPKYDNGFDFIRRVFRAMFLARCCIEPEGPSIGPCLQEHLPETP